MWNLYSDQPADGEAREVKKEKKGSEKKKEKKSTFNSWQASFMHGIPRQLSMPAAPDPLSHAALLAHPSGGKISSQPAAPQPAPQKTRGSTAPLPPTIIAARTPLRHSQRQPTTSQDWARHRWCRGRSQKARFHYRQVSRPGAVGFHLLAVLGARR
ncbi:hypothetical protein GQ53DRAFT_176314 [Thozetella sp. PMI_491]|nr:hypothetical protein GQ53DRAFT_176314 [Thozetella sp. PMI_491]